MYSSADKNAMFQKAAKFNAHENYRFHSIQKQTTDFSCTVIRSVSDALS